MKTVVENNVGLDKQHLISEGFEISDVDDRRQERSCFYDFGARSSVGFTGFVNTGDSAFIDKIGRCFT